jgi:hypothetical protein
MPSAAGDQYSPGPDPDFSYLSLLQPDLLFVQDIQRYVDLATSLGAMADSMQGSGGSSTQALRAQVLQYAGTQAPGLMMDDPTDLPLAMTYQTALGHDFPIYDAFLPSATGKYFAPSDLAMLKQYLDDLPPLLPQYEHFIVIGPDNEMIPQWVSFTFVGDYGGGQSSVEGTGPFVYAELPHEIAATLFNGLHPGPLGEEWDVLWQQSTDPIWDTADVYSGYPPRPMPTNRPIPWGDTNEYEDFMTIVSNWACDSATPRLSPTQSSSMLEQAIYAASQGHTILLQKTLIVAAVFTTGSPLELYLYNYPNYQMFSANPINATEAPVLANPSSLTLRDFTLAIQNGALTSVTSPASQVTVSGNVVKIPALSWTFPNPVPIPGYAVTAWGIQQ